MESLLLAGVMGVLVGALFVFMLRKPKQQNIPDNSKELLMLQENLSKLTERLDTRLDKSQTLLMNSFGKFQQETNQIVKDVTQRLTKLDETNKRVVNVADELKTLQNVLQNPKQRGVLGEYYLQTVLENVLPPGRFKMQYRFTDGEIVDAAIFLQDEKILPVDSKFSLENYNRLVEETDKARRDELTKLIKNDLKKRIDETAKYIRPNENTMDFAFMFLPSEAMYYDLLIANVGVTSRDLIEYAFQEKKVIIVSPTSFLAYLQTVLQGLRSLQIEEQAKEIQKNVGKLGRHLEVYDEFMGKLGSSLGTTVNHFNRAHKELKKVDKDVTKITGSTEVVEPLELEKPKEE